MMRVTAGKDYLADHKTGGSNPTTGLSSEQKSVLAGNIYPFGNGYQGVLTVRLGPLQNALSGARTARAD